MKVIDLAILAVEHESHTLSSVIPVLTYLKRQFAPPRNLGAETAMAARLRVQVVASLERRLGGVLAPKGPAAMATLLDPRHGVMALKAAGFSDAHLADTMVALSIWIDDITRDEQQPDASAANLPFLLDTAPISSPANLMKAKLNEYVVHGIGSMSGGISGAN